MGQYCSDDKQCCHGKDRSTEIQPAQLPRTASEDRGSEFDRSKNNEENSDSTPSYFCREMVELTALQKTGGVQNMKPYKFKTKAVYTGQWQNNMRHGFGTQTWVDGASYSGQWQNNAAIGKGRFTHGDGDMYVGEWSNNMANGLGIFFRSGIRVYQGECRADLQHGHGVEIKVNGARYEGTFEDGLKVGQGCFYWADGSEYRGAWYNDSINGHGVYHHGEWSFKGQFKDSMKHGLGHYSESGGSKYSGGFRGDRQNGFGKFLWGDGATYHGFWFNGRETGPGLSTTNEGGVPVIAHWKDGEFIKQSDQKTIKEPDRAA